MHCNQEETIVLSNAQFYTSVAQIPQETWQQLGCEDDVYVHPKYLSALEKNHSDIAFYYVVLLDNTQKPLAFSTIQIVDFYLDSVQNNLQSMVDSIRCIVRKIGVLSPEKPFKLLTCGNTFVSGEHGIYFKNNTDKKRLIKELVKEISQFVNSNESLKKEVSAFMLKDFESESLFITDELLDYNYYAFNVEPNMVLPLHKDWQSFDDYLSAMKTKFRVKAKKAMSLSANLEVKEVTSESIETLLPQMTNLYKKVSTKAGFNLGDFNLNTYKTLKENLGDDYILNAYFTDNKLVGFLSGIVNKRTLDAHFVGIDYAKNREFAIYQRMLYDYIQIALAKNLTKINFGRTASEIKSSVGAIPQDLTIYLRHKKSIPNRLLSLFLKRIQPTPFNQKHPFKTLKSTT